MDFTHRSIGSGTYEETVEAVERAIGTHGFVISHVHDVHLTLAAKGFDIHPLRIYEIRRHPETLDGVDPLDVDSLLGYELLMPCRINVFTEGEDVVVAAIRPTVMSRIYPDAGIDVLAAGIEDLVVTLVTDATRP